MGEVAATAGPVVGALLAGGASRRMGRDKSTLELAGKPLAHWAAGSLAAVARHRVQVGGAPVPGLGWPVLQDLRPGQGPAAALETALVSFPGAFVLACAVDTPFVPPALFALALRQLRDGGGVAALPRARGRFHPLVGAWSPAALPSLGAWLDAGERSLQEYLATVPVRVVEGAELRQCGDPAEILLNVNTAADLERAAAIAATRARL